MTLKTQFSSFRLWKQLKDVLPLHLDLLSLTALCSQQLIFFKKTKKKRERDPLSNLLNVAASLSVWSFGTLICRSQAVGHSVKWDQDVTGRSLTSGFNLSSSEKALPSLWTWEWYYTRFMIYDYVPSCVAAFKFYNIMRVASSRLSFVTSEFPLHTTFCSL